MAQLVPADPMQEMAALERRLQAYERILQVMIPSKSPTDPRFLDHLTATFVTTVDRAHRHKPEPGASNDHERIVPAETLSGGPPQPEGETGNAVEQPRRTNPSPVAPLPEPPMARAQVKERNGIWSLAIDGIWRGDYRKRAQADAAAELASREFR